MFGNNTPRTRNNFIVDIEDEQIELGLGLGKLRTILNISKLQCLKLENSYQLLKFNNSSNNSDINTTKEKMERRESPRKNRLFLKDDSQRRGRRPNRDCDLLRQKENCDSRFKARMSDTILPNEKEQSISKVCNNAICKVMNELYNSSLKSKRKMRWILSQVFCIERMKVGQKHW